MVYFGFLLLLFMLTERRRAGNPARLFLVPLFVYYLMTLAVPLSMGGYRHGAVFWEHSLFVLLLPLLLLLPLALITSFVVPRRLRRRASE